MAANITLGKIFEELMEVKDIVSAQTIQIDELQEGLKHHQAHHDDNEHLWGVYTLMKRKPLIAFVIGIILTLMIGAGWTLNEVWSVAAKVIK